MIGGRSEMNKILVSGCLFGWHVRYDDKDVPNRKEQFLKWKEEGRLIPVCPEVFGGLPIPRPDSQRIGEKVITCTGEDVTMEYEVGALEAVRLAKKNNVVCCIMKENSPSCGSKFIYDGSFTGKKVEGQGRAVQLLREAGFIVFNEDEIEEVEKLLSFQRM
jgi:uncharacterized protein YbbK (DUF523 family)